VVSSVRQLEPPSEHGLSGDTSYLAHLPTLKRVRAVRQLVPIWSWNRLFGVSFGYDAV
jgi:hypothetical protein